MLYPTIVEKFMQSKKQARLSAMLLAAMFILVLGMAAPDCWADDDEIEFDEASIFFELNDTDGDLGIHARIDGEPWKKLEIEDPREREILDISVKGRLRRQGLTEIFFESAEPPFEAEEEGEVFLPPRKFFKRFPEGWYEIEGETLAGQELESAVYLSHVMPAPPDNVTLNGMPAAEDCDADPLPAVSAPVVIRWDPVTGSHPEIGKEGDIVVARYQVVVEQEDLETVFSVDLPPNVNEVEIPAGFTDLGYEFKFEILVRADSGNQTAVESCFEID